MILDNCGAHQVQAVRAAFAAANVKVGKLPPRMTGELQLMDLVVNGPLKAGVRRERSVQLYDHFQLWVATRRANIAAGEPLQSFAPPAMTIQDGLRLVLVTLDAMGKNEEFKRNLHRVFIEIGQLADDVGHFHRYPGHGVLHTRTEGLLKSDAVGCLADLFAAFSMDMRPDWEKVCEYSSESE